MVKDGKGKVSEVKTAKKASETTEKALAEAKPTEASPAEIKKEEPEKTEPKTVEPKKAEPKNVAPKKETPAPAVAKKAAAAKPKKAVKEKEILVPELFIQYTDDPAGEQEASVSDIIARIKASYVAEGHRESSIKSLRVYMKPQEWKAYYVINNKIEGNIELF